MGTFHHDTSPLHGITVVVETRAGEVWVGRCHDEDDARVVLLDADVHKPDAVTPSRAEWLGRAARFGVFPKHRQVVVPRAEVASLTRLGELV
jgi:hypothetical protein